VDLESSEVSTPGLNDVYSVITAREDAAPRRFVATATASTPEEMEFIHENPIYELYEVHYTTISPSSPRTTTWWRSTLIDLTGQVAAESIGADMERSGGQLEYVIGANLSKGGRSITCLPSSSRAGTISRVVAEHPPGTVITSRGSRRHRGDGFRIARSGKSDRERARELINIAHPDHRESLRRAARRMGI
jgi:hypothetical protein